MEGKAETRWRLVTALAVEMRLPAVWGWRGYLPTWKRTSMAVRVEALPSKEMAALADSRPTRRRLPHRGFLRELLQPGEAVEQD